MNINSYIYLKKHLLENPSSTIVLGAPDEIRTLVHEWKMPGDFLIWHPYVGDADPGVGQFDKLIVLKSMDFTERTARQWYQDVIFSAMSDKCVGYVEG